MKIPGFMPAFAAVLSLVALPASAQQTVNATFHVSVTVDSTLGNMKIHLGKERTFAVQLVHHTAVRTMATKICPECSINPAGCKCDTTWNFTVLRAQSYSARLVMGDSSFAATGGNGGKYSVITYYSAGPTGARGRWKTVNAGHATWVRVNAGTRPVELSMRIPSWNLHQP